MLNARERREAADHRELVALVGELGVKAVESLLKVYPSTIQRWLDGQTKPGEAVLIALRAAAWGQLPGMSGKLWEGWRFGEDGQLHAPNGHAYKPGDLLGQFFERQLIRHLNRQVKLLEEKLRALKTGAANDAVSGGLQAQSDAMIEHSIGRATRRKC